MREVKTADDLKEIPWRHLTIQEWRECSHEIVSGIEIVTDKQIDHFIESQIKKVAAALDLSFYSVEKAFFERNCTFYALKNNLFHVNTGYCQAWNSLWMDALRELFHIPCLSECCRNEDKVDVVLKQKMEYLRILAKLSKAEKRKLRMKSFIIRMLKLFKL